MQTDTEMIHVRLPRDVIERLDRLADEECRSRNSAAAWLLRSSLAGRQVAEPTPLDRNARRHAR